MSPEFELPVLDLPRAHARLIQRRTRRVIVGPDLTARAVSWISYAAALYPLFLCLLNTRVARMPNAALIAAEILILAAAAPVLAARVNLGMLLLCVLVGLNYFVLALIQQANDLKALRDLLMPIIFVWLGYALDDRHRAERILRNLAIVAIVLGSVEWIFPGFYTSLFDVLAFYTSRGFGADNKYALTVLQVRPTGIGRSLLPFLGPRRISSFLIEPVAMGNFAVLTAAWALSKPRTELRQAGWLMAMSVVMLVMADARFGSISVLMLCLVRASGIWRSRIVAAVLPLVSMLVMIGLAWNGMPRFEDTVMGRLKVGGLNLLTMPWSAWLGIPNVISFDAGYGYIIQRTGLFICLAIWIAFCILPMKNDQGRRFHFNVALYAALNLCISGSSFFSLKTTGILWLLLGTTIAHRSIVDHLRVVPEGRTASAQPASA